MRLNEAVALSDLGADSLQASAIQTQVKTGVEVAREIWSEAAERGISGVLGGCETPEKWRQRWLPSKEFRLVRLPLNAAALACTPRESNLVLKKIHAREERPIVVDANRNSVGMAMHGFVPEVIVIDGKHRFQAAHLRGDSHILAWVGKEALEIYALGSGGGGPAPERTVSAPGASLISKAAKKMKAGGQFLPPRSAGSSQNPKITKVASEGLDVKKLHADCKADMKSGKFKFKPEMKAKAPPGCEHVVKGLKEKFGEGSSSPFAIAWHMHHKGSC
jgi:hypothetical protein